MNPHHTLRALLGLSLAWSALAAHAQLAVKGELLLEDNFQQHAAYTKQPVTLKPGWTAVAGHATWERTPDGVKSVFKEGHMPVLKVEGEFTDVVIEVDFRFTTEPGRWSGGRLSVSNPKLHPRAYVASVWANQDNDARARGLVLEHDFWSGPISQVARKAAKFEPGVWYTLRLEIVGNAALASCNGVTVSGSFEFFGLPKTSISLGVGTTPHELRNLRIHAATLSPDWGKPAAATAAK
jgi:hypothetical protein